MLNLKKDFPIFQKKINGKQVIYLNSAATSQKPREVIDSIKKYYEKYNANIHRGNDFLSVESTREFDKVRKKVARFINAETEEIVFTKGATEGINLVMYSLAENFNEGDEIILSVMEHHSNLVPWQELQKKGVKLKFVDIDDKGALKIDELKKMINEKTKIVALTYVSNVLGTINNVGRICRIVKSKNKSTRVLIDAAQAVPHMKIDVKEINCDFLVFSGHKMLVGMGTGVLYGKNEVLEKMRPFLFGGDMIKEVFLDKATFAESPQKFEAGTQNIASVISLGKAIEYLEEIGMEKVRMHEKELTEYALKKLKEIKNIEIYGPINSESRGGVISFNIGGIHSHDIAEFLGSKGISVRAGHMCCMPLMKRLGISSAVRTSFYIYNDKKDIDALVNSIKEAIKFFQTKLD